MGDGFLDVRVGAVVPYDQREFHAALAGDEIPGAGFAGPDGFPPATRDFNQHVVAGAAAHGVVDGLEVVQVDGDHCELLPAGHQRVDQLGTGEFVGQARELVGDGLLPQPGLVLAGVAVVSVDQVDDQDRQQV